MTERTFPAVPQGYPFPALERETLAFWATQRIFERTLDATAGHHPIVPFVFFEGPPTANNTPHVGHVVTRVAKDLFPRFQTMRGKHVARKAGWDTHGLAVEIEVEKRLGISGKKEIEQLVPGDRSASIARFNRACLESVGTYEKQWRAMTERVGYWIDLDDAYFTYSNGYIESVWWALKTLHEKGLLYEGHKSQPYCARCGTTLSSHEVAQNYKEVDDPSIWVLFPVRPGQKIRDIEDRELAAPEGLHLLAWTTTPWTMPGHAGIAAHPDLVYRAVEHPNRPGSLVLFADQIAAPIPYELARDGKREKVDLRDLPARFKVRGSALVGLRYDRPYRSTPFDSPATTKRFDPAPSDEAGWPVLLADYVTATDGTGLVHTAPAFGADDQKSGLDNGLPMLRTIEPNGKVAAKAGLEKLAGLWFKDADKEVIKDLKNRGLLLHSESFRHSYPFCWRCDTPLLQYATESWFVKTTAIRDQLVAKNREIGWRPEAIGVGRFGNWLEGVVDWALSRRRYWGTPLPVWKCDLCPAVEVVGSYEELFALSGRKAPADLSDRSQFDPHRPGIDEVEWECYHCRQKGEHGVFRRVEDVIDAWFDSGAMPFAQHHYPFENRERVLDAEGKFRPADFISEAIDQTRGWFYTLHVLGVALFDDVAFRNCIVLGHVTDEQGRKMSKRLGNVVDPMTVIEETGADALRWYFAISDPEQTARFSARLVRESAQKFLLPLWNATSFFAIYANLDGWHPGAKPPIPITERPELDRWILLRLDETVAAATAELRRYSIVDAARAVQSLVDDLTDWYVRRSRGRFWAASAGHERDKESAYQTLYQALTTTTRLIAPFTPFVAEKLHEILVRSQDNAAEASVHLSSWPAYERLDRDAESDARRRLDEMALIQRIVRLGHAARNLHELKTRQPLASATLVASDPAAAQAALARLSELALDELNVKDLRFALHREGFVRHEVKPNFRLLGKRLGKKMPALKAALEAADGDALAASLESDGVVFLEVDGEPITLTSEEVEIRLVEHEGLATAGDRELLVVLDTHLTPELIAEGRAREVVNRIQTARKEADLDYADRIVLRYRAHPELEAAIATWRDWIAGETLIASWRSADGDTPGLAAADVEGLELRFAIERAV